jgi:hypothetical protein
MEEGLRNAPMIKSMKRSRKSLNLPGSLFAKNLDIMRERLFQKLVAVLIPATL